MCYSAGVRRRRDQPIDATAVCHVRVRVRLLPRDEGLPRDARQATGVLQRQTWHLSRQRQRHDRRRSRHAIWRVLSELNIDIICANSPQAKGRVERAFGTLQDRLVKELRLAGISTIEAANAWVPAFMADYNARFGRDPGNAKDLHRKLSKAEPSLPRRSLQGRSGARRPRHVWMAPRTQGFFRVLRCRINCVHVWMAPWMQGRLLRSASRIIAVMCPAFRRGTGPLALMGSVDRALIISRGRDAPWRGAGFSSPSVDRHCHHAFSPSHSAVPARPVRMGSWRLGTDLVVTGGRHRDGGRTDAPRAPSLPRRFAPSCWPRRPRPASSACCSAAWPATDHSHHSCRQHCGRAVHQQTT